jgi:hypothetical protein
MISDISGMRMRGKFKNALLDVLHLVDARSKKILGEFDKNQFRSSEILSIRIAHIFAI